MKNYQVKYSKGHLVDTSTGRRIFLKRGGTFSILGDDDQFEEKDELHLNIIPLDSKKKLLQLQKKYFSHELVKIADAGQKFVYRIGLSKVTSEERNTEFLFHALILEDLYIRSKNLEDWSLCDCFCETSECLYGEIQMFEPVVGNSLNNLFSNMIAFYFAMQRSGACNAFDTFFFSNDSHYTLTQVKSGFLTSLNRRRGEIIKQFKSKE
ncbi:hypothetical protein D1614_22745 [Maribellus luteus]|uniref:Uncharacterized protein n=1 Tax=Maribellus luteus TaxID=2305463 RepID=A0A399SSM3_9BACT|nr:hypothetical protein [Maribellus luteus]RIJ45492.1 hypothetical protein D1614_22745 [Maribellus luteus]